MNAPAPGPAPRATGPVAIVLARLPRGADAPLLDEISELERQGVPVVLACLHAPEVEGVPSFAPVMDSRTAAPGAAGLRIAARMARTVLRQPLTVTSLAAQWLWASAGSARSLLAALESLPSALLVARSLRGRGIAHVHAMALGDSAFAARLIAATGRGTPLPYSVTARAPGDAGAASRVERVARQAAFTRCLSTHDERRIAALLGGEAAAGGRRLVVPGGVALVERSPGPDDAARAGPLRVIAVASERDARGLRTFVEALRIGRSQGLAFEARIAAPTRSGAALEAHVERAGLAGHVSVLGDLARAALRDELVSADVVVVPLSWGNDAEPLGMPAILADAMAGGAVIVASRAAGLEEFVAHGDSGLLIEVGDAPGMARALLALAGDAAARHRLGTRAREAAEACFDVRRSAARLASALDDAGARLDDADSLAFAEAGARAVRPARAERVGVTTLRRSPRAVTVELLVPMGAAAPRRLVAKRHLPLAGLAPEGERAAWEHGALVALREEGLTVPAALALDRERAIVVMERAGGVPATRALKQARESPDEAMAVAGAAWFWLRQLREARGPERDAAAFSRQAVLGRLRRELRDDAEACIALGLPVRLVRSLHLRCHRELPDAVPDETCWTHGAFWPDNVLVDWRPGWEIARITVVDLAGLQPGLPMEDAAAFLEHLALVLPSILSASRLDRVREQIESVMLVGHDGQATIPEALRAAKALRLAARLLRPPGRFKWLGRPDAVRHLARLLEVRPW